MTWNPKSDYSTPRSQFIKWELVPYTRGRGLDIGCGAIKPFPHFIGIDTKEFQAGGMTIKPDMNMDATDLSIFASQSLDFVFSSHALQWIENYKKALSEAWRVLKPWGHLVLYMPDRRLYEYPKKEGVVLPHLFTPDDMIEAMKEFKGWNLIVNDQHDEDDEYSFFQVYFKTKSEKHQFAYREPKPEKTACVVRYGAFGDLMQASPIIAGLKDDGYHVTVQSSPPGLDVIRYDPNIDHLQIQDKDQVPNVELGQYWAWCKKKYTKFVNLSSSVEGALLAEHDRMMVQWPHEARHALLDHNYVEQAHRIAGLSKRYPVKFYANDAEKQWAKKERAKMGDHVILWSLAGSAVHKTWPYLDKIIARVMLAFPTTTVVLCGGPESEMLEAGWQKEKRVVRTCGKWNIRQSLSFLAEADLVIGPETGVLNAAADMDVAKIIFLSHSSVVNLSRDWKNCVSLFPMNTDCYPCHILHQGWQFCHRDTDNDCETCTQNEKLLGARACETHTGVSKCQADIPADDCWEHVDRILTEKTLKAA